MIAFIFGTLYFILSLCFPPYDIKTTFIKAAVCYLLSIIVVGVSMFLGSIL